MSLPLDDATDAELVALARGGSQQAFRVLTERHREAVYRIVRGAIGNADEALDVTQEAFVAAFGALDRYDTSRPFRTWLTRIALNKSRDWARRRIVRGLFSFAMPEDFTDVIDETQSGADRMTEDRQELARVAVAVAALPSRLKDVLLLRTVDELSQVETADILGVSEKTVETRLYRARRALSDRLSTGDR